MEKERYIRQITLPGVGIEGQEKLSRARVLVVGAGGLAAPVAYYLAAAGVGTLGLVDDDVVKLSNLHRQILYRTEDLGQPKVEVARRTLEALNPEVKVKVWRERLTEENAFSLVEEFDAVVDATDNFPTRALLNRACVARRRLLVHGGVRNFAGEVMTILPGAGPCLACLFPLDREPVPGQTEGSSILGPVPGVIGTLQAVEVLKYLLNLGELLVGRLVVYDALSATFHEVQVTRNPSCPVCSKL
ncbi:UBA/THIF-type NAD/FAD binding protein [Ammonifex degensii KC4]|uniref:UBA/THIF-type NAD/FAD binding protein n=1 Tax=Ammonifex degensii (strain DSM 10501 / KC4) TaxID=429009 RepID=C9RD14_AMMDK|nr:HesA/MoeB/ThiF family protein [Ammonifex degensii]ACX52141.1 UBA/THIF-type NAD/FAD binding protein [Ammonifex degensii KC4]